MILPFTVISSPGLAVARMRWMADGSPAGDAASTADRALLGVLALAAGAMVEVVVSFFPHEGRRAAEMAAVAIMRQVYVGFMMMWVGGFQDMRRAEGRAGLRQR
jgi:hypothetical protein